MTVFWILAGILVLLCAAVLTAAYICFRMAFYAPGKPSADPEAIEIPEGEIYEPFRPQMERWIREARAMPKEHFTVRSFDGLTLHGDYFEYAPGAPIELMFHGYRGSAERDLSGGVQRCFLMGRSALLVDQRCSRRSEGNVITFGIREHRDCLTWVNFMVQHFGPDVKIILTGISMGAATVTMTADKNLPANVLGILADCGYSSPKAIIQKVIRDMGIAPALGYPFVKLGAKLFGGFNLEEDSPEQALKNAKVPVIFYHGQSDDFVPWEMSRSNCDVCASRTMLVTVPDAGHGLSFPVEPERYIKTLADFFGPEASCRNNPQSDKCP